MSSWYSWHQIDGHCPQRQSCGRPRGERGYPAGLPAHQLAQRGCGQGLCGYRGRLSGGVQNWCCPSLWAVFQGPPGARSKTKESFQPSHLSHEIYFNLTLAFFQKGTFGGQFRSKLCCLCSSTCWLAMKHRAAKHSRHTECQAAFQGNAWAASAPDPTSGRRVPASQGRTVPTRPQRGEAYLCGRWGANMRDPQPLQKGQKWPVKQPRRWTAMANSPPRANVNAPARPPLHIGYFVY